MQVQPHDPDSWRRVRAGSQIHDRIARLQLQAAAIWCGLDLCECRWSDGRLGSWLSAAVPCTTWYIQILSGGRINSDARTRDPWPGDGIVGHERSRPASWCGIRWNASWRFESRSDGVRSTTTMIDRDLAGERCDYHRRWAVVWPFEAFFNVFRDDRLLAYTF